MMQGANLSLLFVIYLEVITRLFSHRPVYQSRTSITARRVAEGRPVADRENMLKITYK